VYNRRGRDKLPDFAPRCPGDRLRVGDKSVPVGVDSVRLGLGDLTVIVCAIATMTAKYYLTPALAGSRARTLVTSTVCNF
jgi:hypothetical protein